MENFNPLVSIVIPVYNGSNYMREAIDSALAQTYTNNEIIVVNDGSKDNTEEIALSYGDKIRYFAKENGGQSSALNLGIEKMRGDYFSWLSHDDVYYPNKIEEQVKVLSQLPKPTEAFIYSNYEIVDQNTKHIRFVNNPQIASHEFVYRMLVNIPVNGCTVLIHKSLLQRVGYFTLNKPHTSDVELFLKLGLLVDPYHLPTILVKSRSHGEQATFRNIKQHKYESNRYGIDALNLIPSKILLQSSGNRKLGDIYKYIALLWARRGFIYASFEALKFYRQETNNYINYLFIKIFCTISYFMKLLRRRIVRIIKLFNNT